MVSAEHYQTKEIFGFPLGSREPGRGTPPPNRRKSWRYEVSLRQAYPLIPERMDEDAADFDYHSLRGGETPVDWNYRARMLIHKLMRLVYEEGEEPYLVELLENQRERVAAQEAFALADRERKLGRVE